MKKMYGSLTGWGGPTRLDHTIRRQSGRANFGASGHGWEESRFGRVLLRAVGVVAEGEETDFLMSFPSEGEEEWPRIAHTNVTYKHVQ